MGQGISAPKCDGCGKTTPFFGEIYGRMNEEAHANPGSGMGHTFVNINAKNPTKRFAEFNSFKNKLLIPFYGTVLAIRVLAAVRMQDIDQLESHGLTVHLAVNLKNNRELRCWFALRVVVALVPGLGTVINGALDIIAQIGMQFKAN